MLMSLKAILGKLNVPFARAFEVIALRIQAEYRAKTLEMIRRFVANIADKKAAIWIVRNTPQVVAFLENEMDSLTREERLTVYGFMEGMFRKHFKRILATRLQRETDSKCLELLRAISDIHSEDDTAST